jgi:formylglycine-generating enzyme required for sulfatase activity
MMNPDELVAASGTHSGCGTPEGVYDLVGNLEEWVKDDWRGVRGMLEGGAWYTYPRYADCGGRYSRQPDYRLDPDKRVYSAGFRCCHSEQSLTPMRVAADAARQLSLSTGDPGQAYDGAAEVPNGAGLFIDRFEYPNQPGSLPLTGVDASGAADLCEAAGKRLCGAHEWERACGGADHMAQPYGSRYIRAACAVELDGPTVSGKHFGCTAENGARDLVGSVWEWTDTPLDLPALQSFPGQELRELRGGSWYTDPLKATCQPREGYPAAPIDARFPEVGFRCCRGEPDLAPDLPALGDRRCPEGMVAIADFCIDPYEFPGVAGAQPQTNIDFLGARQVCASAGKRLCTEPEWARACAGSTHRRWPYGNVYVPDRCHDESQARETQAGEALPGGTKSECGTPEGLMDMSGNVWEWVEQAGGGGDIAGGGWNIAAGLGQCSARAHPAPDYSAAETGTRCCHSGLGVAP